MGGLMKKQNDFILPRILFLDIETAPNLATVWDIWNQNIGTNQLLESSYVLCWSAKWKHEKNILFDSVKKSGKKGVVRSVWELLNQADIVIHYNGRKFDIPTLNKEFLLLHLTPPAPYKQVDLYEVVKKKFKFVSNKMGYISKQLGQPSKIETDHQLWLDCMSGKPEAWAKMERYNRKDVFVTEKLYKILIPWIERHPNYGLWADMSKPVCSNCGSTKVQKRGLMHCKTLTYQRWNCQVCGTWLKSKQSEKKLNNKNMLTQAV